MSSNPLAVMEGLNPSTSNLVPSPSGPGTSRPSASTIKISSQTPLIPIPADNQPSSLTSDPSSSIQPWPSSATTTPAINPQNIQSPMTNTAVNGIVTSANVQMVNMMCNFNPHEDQHGLLLSGWERQVDHLGHTYYVDHNTRTMMWNRPSNNQAVNTQAQQETDTACASHNWHILADDLLGTNSGPQSGRPTPTPPNSAPPNVVSPNSTQTMPGAGPF